MEKEAIYKIFFKCNKDGKLKFNDFTQLTVTGKRIIILVLNLALGGKTITTLQWLKDRKVIKSSKYEDKFCYDTICHWKSSGGEVFEKIQILSQ